MKTQNLNISTKFNLFLLLNVFLFSSCGTYLSVYDNDGIYSSEEYKEYREKTPPPRVVVVDRNEYDDYNGNYFERRLESLERIQENDIFLDVDSYASDSEFNDINYSQREPWGREENDVVVNLNLMNDPFWGAGFNNWGFGFNNWGLGFNNWGWGFNNPWGFGNINPFWRGRFWSGRFWGGNLWGFNNWGFNNFGFNNWGWGFNNPWIWQNNFRNNYWFQNNRWSRSNPYRVNRNDRLRNNRFSDLIGRRSLRSINGRFSDADRIRRGTVRNSRNSSVRRGSSSSTRRGSTMRRGTTSSRSRATTRSSRSSSRSTMGRSSSSRSRSSGARSSSRGSSRSSGVRSSSRGSSRSSGSRGRRN